MTADHAATTPAGAGNPPSRAKNITLWIVQALVGLFFVIASALPKLFGQEYAVELFDDIGAGQWLRYVVGVLELAGGIGLLVPLLAGSAALGLIALMVGAAVTQAFILDSPSMVVTPLLLLVLLVVVARGRWSTVKALTSHLRR